MTGWLEALGGLAVLSLLLIYVIGTFFARPAKADELARFRGMSATKRLPFTMDDARKMMGEPEGAEEVTALRARVEALEVDVKNLKAREYR